MVAAAVTNGGASYYAFTESLDTSGNTTSWLEVTNKSRHTIAFKTPLSFTSIVVRAEGSLDGTYFFGIDPSNNGNPDASGNVAVTTKSGATMAVTIRDVFVNYIRLKLVAYSGGGTTVSISSITYRGG